MDQRVLLYLWCKVVSSRWRILAQRRTAFLLRVSCLRGCVPRLSFEGQCLNISVNRHLISWNFYWANFDDDTAFLVRSGAKNSDNPISLSSHLEGSRRLPLNHYSLKQQEVSVVLCWIVFAVAYRCDLLTLFPFAYLCRAFELWGSRSPPGQAGEWQEEWRPGRDYTLAHNLSLASLLDTYDYLKAITRN